jgi:hypothetical protein
MTDVDLERRLSAAFGALGEPTLGDERRRALGPALSARRARRARLVAGVGVAIVVAGLAAGLPLALRSAPVGRVSAAPASATCVEVQIGAAQSCRGALSVSTGAPVAGVASPLPSQGTFAPANAAASPSPSASDQEGRVLTTRVGARLTVTLPSALGVRWTAVSAVPATAPTGDNFQPAAATIRTTRAGSKTVVTVVAIAPGRLVLHAQGATQCRPDAVSCVLRVETWSLALTITAPSAASGS